MNLMPSLFPSLGHLLPGQLPILYTEHDIIWYHWILQVNYPGCVPSQLLLRINFIWAKTRTIVKEVPRTHTFKKALSQVWGVVLKLCDGKEVYLLCAQDATKLVNGRRSRVERKMSLGYGCKKQRERTNFQPGMFSTFTFLISKSVVITGSTLLSMKGGNSKKTVCDRYGLLTGRSPFFQCVGMKRKEHIQSAF